MSVVLQRAETMLAYHLAEVSRIEEFIELYKQFSEPLPGVLPAAKAGEETTAQQEVVTSPAPIQPETATESRGSAENVDAQNREHARAIDLGKIDVRSASGLVLNGVAGTPQSSAAAEVTSAPLDTESRAKPAVEAVDGSAMSEVETVVSSPETAEVGSRVDAGRTASATSEIMDATGGESAATQSAVDADVEEQELIEIGAAPENATARPQAGEASSPSPASPAPTSDAEPVTSVPAAQAGQQPPAAEAEAEPTASRLLSPPPPPTTKDRLRALHAEHPEYSMRAAANILGAAFGTVQVYSGQLGIKWASAPKKAAPVPRQAAPPPPVVRKKSSSPSKFNLVADDGMYLHESCQGLTPTRKFAWEGDQTKLAAVRRNFAIATDMREVAVPLELERA